MVPRFRLLTGLYISKLDAETEETTGNGFRPLTGLYISKLILYSATSIIFQFPSPYGVIHI